MGSDTRLFFLLDVTTRGWSVWSIRTVELLTKMVYSHGRIAISIFTREGILTVEPPHNSKKKPAVMRQYQLWVGMPFTQCLMNSFLDLILRGKGREGKGREGKGRDGKNSPKGNSWGKVGYGTGGHFALVTLDGLGGRGKGRNHLEVALYPKLDM